MKKLLCLISCIGGFLQGQNVSRLSFSVSDVETGRPLTEVWGATEPEKFRIYASGSGDFYIDSLRPGLINLWVKASGYEPAVFHEIQLFSGKNTVLKLSMKPAVQSLDEITIEADAFEFSKESPLSRKKISWSDLYRLPGSNLDITKAIQTYPGVLPKSGFGYNLSFRGGASSENVYTIDGIVIPALNHFSVQGASGGPNALFNLDFLQHAEIQSAAFPAAQSNLLSGYIAIKQKEARNDRWGGRFTMGSTDYGLMLEGPVGKKASLMFSVRNSFSQYYLKAFNVPVLPTYKDAQFRLGVQLNEKTSLIVTGMGGADIYRLNTGGKATDALLYNIGYIPQGNQQVGVIGVHLKQFISRGYWSVILSADGFANRAEKFLNNSNLEKDKNLSFSSTEVNQHFRLERHLFWKNKQLHFGVNAQNRNESLSIWQKIIKNNILDTVSGSVTNNFLQYGAFFNYNHSFFAGRLSTSAGVRADGWSYHSKLQNPLDAISPRVSFSYLATSRLRMSANVGRYYAMPSAVIRLYNALYNFKEEIRPILSNQISLGTEYQKSSSLRFGAEVYYKQHRNYPFLINDSICAANAVAGYVSIANQASRSVSRGEMYGFELFVQQKLNLGYYWQFNYNFSRSIFSDRNEKKVVSVWDAGHYASLNAGRVWGKGWQMGIRVRYSSGTPYTPYDLQRSADKNQWDLLQRGVFDYNRLNELRLPGFYQVDFRVDKSYTHKKWSWTWFIDLCNLTSAPIPLMPYLTLDRDAQGNPQINPQYPSSYLTKEISSDTGRLLPTIGFMVDF